jgi:hypothetical protein
MAATPGPRCNPGHRRSRGCETPRSGYAAWSERNGELPAFNQAAETAAMLQQAALRGLPLLIPGAFEARAGLSPVSPVARVTTEAETARVSSRRRLELGREGGGAPRERAAARPATIFARLWRRVFHPSQIPLTWRRALPR